MVRFLVNKPIAVIMIFLALSLLGILAAKKIPISMFPDIDIPEITVHVSKSNTASAELESAIISRLRAQLVQVPGLDDIHSETRNDYSILKLRFDFGTDINFAFIEVNEKIDFAMNSFPSGMERPRVMKASIADIPVFYINLALREGQDARSFIGLSDFASQVVKRRLEQLPEIAFADVTGVGSAEIAIVPDKVAMAALGFGLQDFKHIIEGNNLLSGRVTATEGQLHYFVHFISSEAINAEDLRNITFRYKDRLLKLSDIAKISIQEKEQKGAFMANNKRSVNLAVIKQSDSRMDDLRQSVKKVLDKMRKDYPAIEFTQTRDETLLLEFSISSLRQDLYLGSGLAFILMFFFLRNVRSPLLLGITLPVCLIITILSFNLFHLSINIISLSGLVLGVGLMIDNSIIVIDNITQYRDKGFDLVESCSKGASEVLRPMIASCMTTCSVFLPLVFLSGISGAIFYDQAMAISLGLSISLIVSVTLLPVLYKLIHLRHQHSAEKRFFQRFGFTFFERMYEVGFYWIFRNKVITIVIVACLIISNIFLFNRLKKEKLPQLEETELVASIDWNKNITVEENRNRVVRLIRSLGEEAIETSAMIGEQQYFLSKEKTLSPGECQVYIRAGNTSSIAAIRQRIADYLRKTAPYAVFSLGPPKNIFERLFGDDEPQLVARIAQSGDERLPDREKIAAIAAKIISNFPDATISGVPFERIITLHADPERLLLYGVSVDAVVERLKSVLNISVITSLNGGKEEIPVVLSDQKMDLRSALREITVPGLGDSQIPISTLLETGSEEVYKTIYGGKNGVYVPLYITMQQPAKVAAYIESEIKGRDNMEVVLSGSLFSNKQQLKEMVVVLLVAVLLLYFILAAQFESLIQPLIVLFELPISMSGAIIMLFLFGSSVNLISLIGMIVICGIVINDSILKIDMINSLRRQEGYTLIDAIHIGGVRRLKSILMTSITTILSVVPFLFGNDMGSMLQRPMSLTLIGGMLIGTPVSLYFIPLVYWFCYRKKDTVMSI